MAYVIKITDLTGEGKPDLYYAEPRDMRRALVADINQAKKYATEDEAYDEIDDSDVAELVVDYGYYTWESDINGDVDDVDNVPGDAIDIITESKSLKDIRNQMKRIVESIGDIKSDLVKLDQFNKEIKTYEDCLNIVKQNGNDIKYIPERFIDYNLCLEAIKNGAALDNIPANYIDYDLCLEAIKHNAYNLKAVPANLIDYNLCLEAVKSHPTGELWFIPEKFKTKELCLLAVKKNGSQLQYVPEKLKDEEMCLTAFNADLLGEEFAVIHIPEHIKEKYPQMKEYENVW